MNLVPKESTISYQRQLEIVAKEKEYRANEALNYSSIKDFDEQGPFEFYKKHVAKDRQPKKEGDAMDMGNLVDCLLTVPDTFNDRFFIISDSDIVIGQKKELVDEMFSISKRYYNEETDSLDISFEEVFRTAFDSVQIDKSTGSQVKFKGKTWEDVIGLFNNGPMEAYYNVLLENIKKRGVTGFQVEMAEAIVKNILSVPKIYDIYNRADVEIHNQYALYFTYKDFKMKGLIDTLHINHEQKWIQEFDLKTSWSTIDFEYNRIQSKYYLQEATYYVGLKELFPNYTVRPRKYIIADSRNHIRPYIAATTSDHLAEGLVGFTTPNGRTYKGLNELLDNLKWHFDNSIWNTTKEIHDNSDEIILKTFGY